MAKSDSGKSNPVQEALKSAQQALPNFKWTNKLSCVSCYKILAQAQQFNEAVLSFDAAPDALLSSLNYFVMSSATPALLQASALMLTQQYVKLLSTQYLVAAQMQGIVWTDVQLAMHQLLIDKKATVKQLANLVDVMIKFQDE